MYEHYGNLASSLRDPLTMIFLFVGLLGSCALLASRCFQRAADRRRIWQAHYLFLVLFLALEITGFGSSWNWLSPMAPKTADGTPTSSTIQTSKDPSSATSRQRPNPEVTDDESNLPLARLLLLSWALGTAALWGRMALAHLLLLSLRRQLKPLSDRPLLQRIMTLSRILGIRGPLASRESSRLASPMIFGIFRPTLVLPRKFASLLEPEQQDAVLIHEFMHIRSHDSFWSAIAEAVTALAWWHPMIWWAEISFAREMESAADEASLVLHDQGPVWLAEAILKLGTEALWTTTPATLAITGTGGRSFLQKRIRNLLSLKPSPLSSGASLYCAVMVPALMAIVGIALAVGARPLIAKESVMFPSEGASCWRHSLAGSLMALLVGPSPLPASSFTIEGEVAHSMESQEPKTEDPKANTPDRHTVMNRVYTTWIRSAAKTEEASADFACFSKEQKTAFAVLLKERAQRTKEFQELKGGAAEEGIKINKWYNEELKKLISPRQYELYVEYWNNAKAHLTRVEAPRWIVTPSAKQPEEKEKKNENKNGNSSRSPDFGGMEDRILAQIDLSQTQKEEVAKAREKLAKENQAYKEVVKKGDANEIAQKAGEINHLARSSMQKIMTEAQFAKYLSLWNGALGIKPVFESSKLAAPVSPAAKIEK